MPAPLGPLRPCGGGVADRNLGFFRSRTKREGRFDGHDRLAPRDSFSHGFIRAWKAATRLFRLQLFRPARARVRECLPRSATARVNTTLTLAH